MARLILTWLFFPPAFIYLVLRSKQRSSKHKIGLCLSSIFSPFTIALALGGVLAKAYYDFTNPPRELSTERIEHVINIELPESHTVERNHIQYIGFDYTAEVNIRFEKESFKEIERQILRSKYFNFDSGDCRTNDDDLTCQALSTHLKNERLTGHWVREAPNEYAFIEPLSGDGPPFSTRFGESYIVDATLSGKSRTLSLRLHKI